MKSFMPITTRQRRMLERLIDLYRETRGPIHYTLVAQRLGLSNTTTYEMLKLLEREGYVTSQYILNGNAGPGRSSVVFAPTRRADAAFRLLTSGLDRDSEWDGVKKQILASLLAGGHHRCIAPPQGMGYHCYRSVQSTAAVQEFANA